MDKKPDVIAQISARLEELSDSEKRIATYVVANPEAVTSMTLRELAAESGTSAATVSRFARTLDYKSFSDLRCAMAITLGDADAKTFGRNRITLDDVDGSVDYFLKHKMAELTETASHVDAERLKSAVKLMRNAQQVLIVAAGNTITIAQNAAFKLSQTGVRVGCPATVESAITASVNLGPSDVVLALSTSGCSRRLGIIFSNAEDADSPIVMVTDNPNTMLSKRASIIIRAVTHDAMFSERTRFSQNSINFVIELLYLFLLTGWDDNVEKNTILTRGLDEDGQF